MATTMINQKFKTFGQLAGMVLAVGALSGLSACTSATNDDAGGTAPASAPITSASTEADTSSPASSTPADTTSDPAGEPSNGDTQMPQCASSDLQASLGEGDGGGAGHMYPTIVLTNDGDESCALKGYPGVSLVTGDDGTQLGAPAEEDSSGPDRIWVTMAPGESVQAQMDIVQAANYDEDECKPEDADGFRIYPPGETESIFLAADDFTGCANEDVSLMTVRALEPVS